MEKLQETGERAPTAAAEATRSLGNRQSRATRKTIRQMLKAQVITEAAHDDVVNSIIFLVPEPLKGRNRIIAWPLWANQEEYEWCHEVAIQTDIVDLLSELHTDNYAAVFDLRCSFYQIDISQATKAFVFEVDGHKYKWTRLPMGYSASAEIMQLVSQAIAQRATQATSVKAIVHVDNILYIGNYAEVQQAITNTLNIAEQYKFTFSETSITPSRQVTFHGVILDFDAKTATLSTRSADKLTQYEKYLAEQAATSSGHIVPLTIFEGTTPLLKVLATATFWSRTMFRGSRFRAGAMATKFQCLQLVRAVAREAQKEQHIFHANRGAVEQLRAWLRSIPRSIEVPAPQFPKYKITTDASVTGGGAVVRTISGDIVQRLAWPWQRKVTPAEMGKYELRSIVIALRNCPIQNTACDLYTDSQIAIGAIMKGYSPSRDVNDELIELYRICREKNIFLSNVIYVPTELNEADSLSRAVTSDTPSDDSSLNYIEYAGRKIFSLAM